MNSKASKLTALALSVFVVGYCRIRQLAVGKIFAVVVASVDGWQDFCSRRRVSLDGCTNEWNHE